jgi:hypothetical protein
MEMSKLLANLDASLTQARNYLEKLRDDRV